MEQAKFRLVSDAALYVYCPSCIVSYLSPRSRNADAYATRWKSLFVRWDASCDALGGIAIGGELFCGRILQREEPNRGNIA